MDKFLKYAATFLIISIPMIAVGIYGVLMTSKDQPKVSENDYQELDWRALQGLDYKTGTASEKLSLLNGKRVKIPGFIVPLDDNAQEYSEFLLVPNQQACIHVPPPPPNQMVLVNMVQGKAPQRTAYPMWIKGRLHIKMEDSPYGKVGFRLYAEATEAYVADY